MLYSFQTKILIIIAVIFCLLTGSVLYLTKTDVKDAVLKAEKKNIENINQIILLNIEGNYKNLLSDKWQSIIDRKKGIKNQSLIINSAVKKLYNSLKETPEKKKKQIIIKWLESVETDSQIFASDKNHKIIYNSEKKEASYNLSQVYDFKSRPVSENINTENSIYDKYTVFSWTDKKQKKIAYLKFVHELEWTIGIAADISAIEKKAERKKDEIIKVLKDNFSKIQLGEKGGIFLFDNSGKILIPPSDSSGIKTDAEIINKLKSLNNNPETDSLIKINHSLYNAQTSKVKALNWYISVVYPEKEIQKPADILFKRLSVIISLIFISGLIVLIFAVKRFSEPIKNLTEKIKTIPQNDITSPDLYNSLESEFLLKRKDEAGDLANAFIFMFKELRKNIDKLVKTTAAKEKIESELNVARDIQMGILPKIFPPYPEKSEIDIYAYLKPAKEVGGDLYDFFFIDEKKLCFVIGDVSDKGVPAALFMAITKTLIKIQAENEHSPAKIMNKVNNILSRDNPNCMFVTLIIGILNTETGKIRYANAGHNPLIIKNKDKTYFNKGLSGPVAGAMEDIEYKELTAELDNDDLIFLYTDGVTEAMNNTKNLFSDQRLLDLISMNSFKTAQDYIFITKEDVVKFTDDEPQSDDITMLSIIFKG
ncbi:MAG: SpoIIE family protein phosphatase [Candidatus Muiribacteriota bacterium]